ncbi:hypothetical protein CPB86DRAFT_311394 [Serendipita vermifera]|nr:hypothetical protein CPB86DRAFT_311394 [Serendipita vermifera]
MTLRRPIQIGFKLSDIASNWPHRVARNMARLVQLGSFDKVLNSITLYLKLYTLLSAQVSKANGLANVLRVFGWSFTGQSIFNCSISSNPCVRFTRTFGPERQCSDCRNHRSRPKRG